MAKTVKKAPAKKAPVKKTPAKKVVVKTGAKVSAKSAVKVPAKGKNKPKIVHVQLHLTRKVPIVAKQPALAPEDLDNSKAVAFASAIAQQLKRETRQSEAERESSEIRLSRRPTTRTQGKSTNKFPEADLREFRKRLLEARAATLAGADAMRATGFSESDDHESDGGDGTNQTLRLQALGQMGNINRTLQQIEEALHRIDDGTYGVCTSCGQLIRKPRLMNQPFVQTCMECQSEMERATR